MVYGENLKLLRKSKNLTQKDLANLLGILEETYGQYEREYTIMPLKHLIVLCNYFDVSLDYIFNFNNKLQYSNNKNKADKSLSGQRLKDIRKELKLSQVKLATLLNTSNSIISDYEKGRYLIATHFLFDLCKKYNISTDYLIGKIDKPKYLK